MICVMCKLDKDDQLFSWKVKSSNKRQSKCKDCTAKYSAEHYKKNSDVYKNRARQNSPNYRTRNIQFIVRYLKLHPCIDCGESDIIVLQFDHLKDKVANISRMISNGNSIKSIVSEIEKCEVVCANCHSRRTCARSGWLRAGMV